MLEALAVAAYAVVLVLLAVGLEGLARYVVWQAHRYRVAGFRYHRALDAWECPQGEHLRPFTMDDRARVIRYRARAYVCNACPAKPRCTDSDDGRQIEHDLRPSLGTSIGRFHRGMSLVLLVLAGLIALIEVCQHPTPRDSIMLGTLAVAVGILGGRLYSALRTASGPPRQSGLRTSSRGRVLIFAPAPGSTASRINHLCRALLELREMPAPHQPTPFQLLGSITHRLRWPAILRGSGSGYWRGAYPRRLWRATVATHGKALGASSRRIQRHPAEQAILVSCRRS